MVLSVLRNHAALYCSDEDLLAAAVRAGKISGDLTFPLPYCPEFYRNEFRSQVIQQLLPLMLPQYLNMTL